MSHRLYPLKFEPIYQYRIWGGRRLQNLLSKPLPGDDPIGEAWILSDRKDHASKVSQGPLKDKTITQLMKEYHTEIMGKRAKDYDNFPLLLKFLDCKEVLSVQVHPSDEQTQYIPEGDSGKTEAWMVLETADDSRIYAGLTEGTTKEELLKSIKDKTVKEHLHSFTPKKGDGVFIKSGTVHTLGGAVVFEVQENSDVTFRLYDWDRTDPKTGKPRELQVEKAVACIDFDQTNIGPVTPVKDPDVQNAEKLFDNQHFKLWRFQQDSEFTVGLEDEPAILVCVEGKGGIRYSGQNYEIKKGEVILLPASLGRLRLSPAEKMTLFQISIPEKQ